MTTTERLEAITDRGLFEALATAVLRESDPDCAALIHTGLNASMETIRAAVDGFVRVPGSIPARYIFVAHSTTDRPGLKTKWLSERGADEAEHGDLIKAARSASALRIQEPDAEFRTILTTNQRVSEPLALEVDRAASRMNIGYEIWEQHRLAHFLDIHPEGQWIRRKYLGVMAERVSRSLLHTLAAQSITEYRRSLNSDSDRWIDRHTAGDVSTHSITGDVNLRLLLADSGLGKSTAACVLLQNAHQAGHLALWLPAGDIASSTTISEALGKALLRLEPALQADAGRVALALETDHRVVLVVDDINRYPSPENLLRKLLAWTRPAASDEKEGSGNVPFIVCPVWTAVWAGIRSGFERQSWLQVSPIGLMDASEARTALSSSRIAVDAVMLEELAQSLGNDPFLIGLFGEIAGGAPVEQLASLARDALGAFIEQVLRRLGEFLPEELDDALVQFAEWALNERQLYPRWENVQKWITADPVSGPRIRSILRNGILARVDVLQAGNRVVFRHDRIRDHLLERAIERALAESRSADIIADPHYAELVAGAFALRPNHSSFSQLEAVAPFAIIALLRHLDRMDAAAAGWVRPRIAQWANTFFTPATITKGVRTIATELLLDANDPTAILIADRLGSGEWLDLARLRNGDLQAGIRTCKPDRVMGFAPSVRHPTRDRAIQIAFSRFGERMHRELAAVLSDRAITDEEREGALALAGLAHLTGLDAEIVRCWKNAADQTRLLADTIWAVVMCYRDNAPGALDPLLDAWGELSEEIGEGGSSPRLNIADALSGAFRHGLPEAVLRYLAHERVRRTHLQWYLAAALERVDDPIAIECVVRAGAEDRQRSKESGGFSSWASSIADVWDVTMHGTHLSESSRGQLQLMWSNPEENEWVRIQALHMWVRAEGNSRLELLRGIRKDEPHHRHAVWHRAAAGDPRVVPEILGQVESEPHWLRFAGKLWSPEVQRATEKWLKEASHESSAEPLCAFPNLHFHLARIFTEITPDDAEPLLEAHWQELRRFLLFIQSALFIGTPRTRHLAAEAIEEIEQKAAVFRHVHHTFGVADSRRSERLTLQHFEALKPYFQFIDQQSLEHIARQCARMGLREWAAEHVRPYLTTEVRLRKPLTEEDLADQLEDWLRRNHLEIWIHTSAEATDGQRRALEAATAYYHREPGTERFEVLGEVIATLGTRADLISLEQLSPPGEDHDEYLQDIALRVRRRSLE